MEDTKRHNWIMFSNLFLHIDVELADTLKGQLLLLDQDSDRFTHEFLCDLQHISGHGGRQQDNLRRQTWEDLLKSAHMQALYRSRLKQF